MSPADELLCAYGEKLTLRPTAVTAADLQELRDHGFSDRAIHDAAQVVASFNYFNRLADGLGLEPENFVRAWERSPAPTNSD